MKSVIYGTNEALIVDEQADSDGELSIFMAVTACDAQAEAVHTWLNKEQAQKLIKHLEKAFKIVVMPIMENGNNICEACGDTGEILQGDGSDSSGTLIQCELCDNGAEEIFAGTNEALNKLTIK